MGAWGSKIPGTNRTGIDNVTEQFIVTDVKLKPGESAHVQITIDNEDGSTVTDLLIISLYTSLRDTIYDDVPWQQWRHLPATVSAERRSILVNGPGQFRIGVLSGGGTDTYTATCSYILDGVEL